YPRIRWLCSLRMTYFVLSRDVHRRHLHSFPTRRSSDLSFLRGEHLRGPVGADHGRVDVACQRELDAVQEASCLLETVDAGHRRQDRQSTRLNSSHVKISYAVFCLKKKTGTPGSQTTLSA